MAERARNIPAARLSRSVEGGITNIIGGLLALYVKWQSAELPAS